MKYFGICVSVAVLLAVGCGPEDKNGPKVAEGSAISSSHAHAHPSQGPHHGTLVELGNEEYHAEVVHTADTVTIYMLDAHAESAVAVDALELVINVVHDGQPKQYKLLASPEAGQPEGQSSRFTLADRQLAAHIDDDHVSCKLSVTIDGKPYRGEIHHDHENGHDHPH